MYERLNQLAIDGEGKSSLGSDHRRINLKFDSGGARQETTEVGHEKLSDKQIADIVNNVERELEAQPAKVEISQAGELYAKGNKVKNTKSLEV